MRARISTPYYLAGKQKERFHSQHMRKGIATAAVAGGIAAAAHYRPYQTTSLIGGGLIHPHTIRNVAIGASAGYLAYGGYHAIKAHQAKVQKTQRRIAKAGNK